MILLPQTQLGPPYRNELQVLGANRIRDPTSSIPRPETIVVREPFKVKWKNLYDWTMKDRLVRVVIDLNGKVSVPITATGVEDKAKDFVWFLLQLDLDELVLLLPSGNGGAIPHRKLDLILSTSHSVISALAGYINGRVRAGKQPAMIKVVNAGGVDDRFHQFLSDKGLALRVPVYTPLTTGKQINMVAWITRILWQSGQWTPQEAAARVGSCTLEEWIASKR